MLVLDANYTFMVPDPPHASTSSNDNDNYSEDISKSRNLFPNKTENKNEVGVYIR
jgi:hypothetical protein